MLKRLRHQPPMARPKISTVVQEQVRHRAGYLCEYCHTDERWQYTPFTIDHVIPLADGGADALENLALACFHCNRRKSSHQNAPDPERNEIVPLFNPRQDRWSDHFQWSPDALLIMALTATGRATIALLDLNRSRVVHIRAADVEVGRHPPATDLTPPDNG